MSVVVAVYAGLGALTWLRDEAVKRPVGVGAWHVIDFIPTWSLSTWLIIILATLLLFAVEGSYRFANATRTATEKEYAAKILALEEGIAALSVKLELPLITPYILNLYVASLGRPSIVTVVAKLRLENKHRVPAVVDEIWLELKDINGKDLGRHKRDRDPVTSSSMQQARVRAQQRLDERPCVEFGMPQVGDVCFVLSAGDVNELSQYGSRIVVKDGVGSITVSETTTISLGH